MKSRSTVQLTSDRATVLVLKMAMDYAQAGRLVGIDIRTTDDKTARVCTIEVEEEGPIIPFPMECFEDEPTNPHIILEDLTTPTEEIHDDGWKED